MIFDLNILRTFFFLENLSEDGYTGGLIRWMTQSDPEQRPNMMIVFGFFKRVQSFNKAGLRRIGNIKFSPGHVLFQGSFTTVFLGRSKGIEVAVKWFDVYRRFAKGEKEQVVWRERDVLAQLDHPNVIKLIDYDENDIYA